MCLDKSDFLVKGYEQTLHLRNCFPVCEHMCLLKSAFELNVSAGHFLHLCFLEACVAVCLVKCSFWENEREQTSHRNGFSFECVRRCFVKFVLKREVYGHKWHEKWVSLLVLGVVGTFPAHCRITNLTSLLLSLPMLVSVIPTHSMLELFCQAPEVPQRPASSPSSGSPLGTSGWETGTNKE